MPSSKQTFTEMLRKWAQTVPDREAYVFRQPPSVGRERLSITFSELDKKSSLLAAWMLEMGLRPGDRVMAVGDNCPGWVYLEPACMKIKVLILKSSGAFTSTDALLELLRVHHCSALFVNPGEEENLLNRVNASLPLSKDGVQEQPGLQLRHIVSLTSETTYKLPNLNSILESTPNEAAMKELKTIQDEILPSDLVTTFFTSGSTGRPKIVAVTHQGFGCVYQGFYDIMGFEEGTNKVFNDRHFSWGASFAYTPLMFGVTNVCVDPKYTMVLKEYDFVFDVFVEENISHATLLPYMLYDIVEQAKKRPPGAFSSLRGAMTGGERVSQELLSQSVSIIPRLSMAYGLSEFGLIAKWNARETDEFGEILDDVEIKILLDGKPATVGDIGEIMARGPHMFHGYLDDDKETRAVFSADGWLHTGDMGKMDSRGRIQVVGRKSEAISHAGSKIYPAVIEKVVKEMTSVAQCVVVGVPDPRVYEEICAFVIPNEGCSVTTEDVVNHIKAQMLGNPDIGGVPKYMLFGDRAPTGSTGKVDRKAIRAMAVEKFALG